jgi:hypothetical protein
MGLFNRTKKEDKMRQDAENEGLAKERDARVARETEEEEAMYWAGEERRAREQIERDRAAREEAKPGAGDRQNEERHAKLPSVWQVD